MPQMNEDPGQTLLSLLRHSAKSADYFRPWNSFGMLHFFA